MKRCQPGGTPLLVLLLTLPLLTSGCGLILGGAAAVAIVLTDDDGGSTGPLRVTSSHPADGAEGVSVDARIVLHFSRAVDPTLATEETVRLESPFVPADLEVASGGRVVILTPRVELEPDHTYRIEVSSELRTPTDRPIHAAFSADFRTGADDVAPRLRRMQPVAVSGTSNDTITLAWFDRLEPLEADDPGHYRLESPPGVSLSLAEATFLYDPAARETVLVLTGADGPDLLFGAEVRVIVEELSDENGNRLASPLIADAVVNGDNRPPEVASVRALDRVDPTGETLEVVFDEAMAPEAANDPAHYQVEGPGGGGVPEVLQAELLGDSTTLRLTLDDAATPGLTRLAIFGVTDRAGNPIVPATYDLVDLQLAEVDPATGFLPGGTAVRLTGAAFTDAGPVAVTFRGIPATEVAVVDAGTLVARTPPGLTGGPVDVEVVHNFGRALIRDAFRYLALTERRLSLPVGAGSSRFEWAAHEETVHVVYLEQGSNGPRLLYARSRDAGTSFDRPRDLQPGATVAWPRIVVAGDLVRVAFATGTDIHLLTSDDGGDSFTGPVTANDAPMALPGGQPFDLARLDATDAVLWFRTGTGQARLSRRLAPTQPFEPSQILDPAAIPGNGPRLVPEAEVLAGWVAQDQGVVVTSSDAGATWSLPVRLSTPSGVLPGGPGLGAAADGTVLVVLPDADDDLYLFRRVGAEFAGPSLLEGGVSDPVLRLEPQSGELFLQMASPLRPEGALVGRTMDGEAFDRPVPLRQVTTARAQSRSRPLFDEGGNLLLLFEGGFVQAPTMPLAPGLTRLIRAEPQATQVVPPSPIPVGTLLGGTRFAIVGEGFSGPVSVEVDGRRAEGEAVHPERLTVLSPAGVTPGLAPVEVSVNGTAFQLPDAFRYEALPSPRPPSPVPPTGLRVDPDLVVGPTGDLLVVWAEETPADGLDLFISRCPGGAGSFAPPALVAGGPGDQAAPALGFFSGYAELIVAFEDGGAVYFVTSVDGGETWTSPEMASTTDATPGSVDVPPIHPSPDPPIVWADPLSGTIRATTPQRVRDNLPEEVVSDVPDAEDPTLLPFCQEAVVAWDTKTAVHLRRGVPGSFDEAAPSQRLDDGGSDGSVRDNVQLAYDATTHQIVAIWEDERESTAHLFGATSGTLYTVPATNVALTSGLEHHRDPALWIDPAGRLHLAWRVGDGEVAAARRSGLGSLEILVIGAGVQPGIAADAAGQLHVLFASGGPSSDVQVITDE